MKSIPIFFLSALLTTHLLAQTTYQTDFAFFRNTVNDNFAYFDKIHSHWNKVKDIYEPYVDTCLSRNSFIHILEMAMNELYNGHNFLNTNTDQSNRLIPSGADLKVVYSNGKFVIDEVRQGFNAQLCGLRKGMQVVGYNNQEIDDAIQAYLPRTTTTYDSAMYEYAANMLLAGTHDTKRKITVSGEVRNDNYYPDRIQNKTEAKYPQVLDYTRLQHNIGYIKINNSLGNDELIPRFDTALDSLIDTDGLILDLRETPGGGTSTIARAMMGRFINTEMPYQKHIYTAEERETGIKRITMEYVAPRLTIYKNPLVVLVGYWTASMGEGMAIGFDAMRRATIVGTKMACLWGEIFTFETPALKVPFSFPCVQLQTVGGLPREDYLPAILVNDQQESIDISVKRLAAKE